MYILHVHVYGPWESKLKKSQTLYKYVCVHTCIPLQPLYFLLLNEKCPFFQLPYKYAISELKYFIYLHIFKILKYFKELYCFHLQMAVCPFLHSSKYHLMALQCLQFHIKKNHHPGDVVCSSINCPFSLLPLVSL